MKYPRIASIVNWFRNVFKDSKVKENRAKIEDVVRREKELSKERRKAIIENEQERLASEKAEKNEINEFKEYIKQIAEKGKEKVEEEKRQDAKNRLQELKKAAYDRESAKFGEEYAKKSYNAEEKDER